MHKLGLRETSTRGLEQILFADVLGVHIVPGSPAKGKLVVHHTLDTDLSEVSNALLTLALEFLFHLPLKLRLAPSAVESSCTGHIQICSKVPDLCLQGVDVLLSFSKLLVRSERCFVCRLRMPVVLPVLPGVDELWLGEPGGSCLQQVALVKILAVHIEPCSPAQGELMVHHSLDAQLPKVLHTSLAFALKLLLQLTLPLELLTLT